MKVFRILPHNTFSARFRIYVIFWGLKQMPTVVKEPIYKQLHSSTTITLLAHEDKQKKYFTLVVMFGT